MEEFTLGRSVAFEEKIRYPAPYQEKRSAIGSKRSGELKEPDL